MTNADAHSKAVVEKLRQLSAHPAPYRRRQVVKKLRRFIEHYWRRPEALDDSARALAKCATGKHLDDGDPLPRVAEQGSRDRDERQRIYEILKLELDASSSLNQRATTFFALLAATAAAVIAFAGAFWLKQNDAGTRPVTDEVALIAGVLAVLAILCLLAGAIFGLFAVVPRSAWRQEAVALLALHVVGAEARWHSGVLVDVADKQRIHNERKAWNLRRQTLLLAFGVGFTFIHVAGVILAAAL